MSPLPSARVLRRALVFALSRFACPCHVTCVVHGSVRAASATGGAAGLAGIPGGRGHSRVAVPPGVHLQTRRASLICGAGFACRASAASIPLAFLPYLKQFSWSPSWLHSAQSVNVGPLVCPSRAAPRPFLTDSVSTYRRCGSLGLCRWPRLSLGARPVRPAPPFRPSLASRLLIPVRLPPSTSSRGRSLSR